MKLAFLVNGKDALDLLAGIPFPESSKHSIGHYGKRDVFVVTVSFDRKTVQSTKMLADYRDQLLAIEKNKMPKMGSAFDNQDYSTLNTNKISLSSLLAKYVASASI